MVNAELIKKQEKIIAHLLCEHPEIVIKAFFIQFRLTYGRKAAAALARQAAFLSEGSGPKTFSAIAEALD